MKFSKLNIRFGEISLKLLIFLSIWSWQYMGQGVGLRIQNLQTNFNFSQTTGWWNCKITIYYFSCYILSIRLVITLPLTVTARLCPCWIGPLFSHFTKKFTILKYQNLEKKKHIFGPIFCLIFTFLYFYWNMLKFDDELYRFGLPGIS